ncbi:MAG TPA: cytochrome c oxidase subunit 3 [Saprospiraceae bacterium]|nr:cytochrome c oxidase subunit 3 [Saprospiraceae bacterium]HRO08124.1 cytochrome c oxidase subunit 3 [Saprospiraceae bacterium]HRO72191.1 cytochrome c oxidase subunit 3 [Saprospiraceae bacterium]HRP41517.1 cytochrome c oxidase subunit 3 [Saprospiraceae bacterium]
MASDTLTHEPNTDHNTDNGDWQGGKEPFKASYGKLMIWYFLLSDAFTFAGFLIAYGTLRFSVATWPVPDFVFSTFPGGFHHKPLLFVTLMTFVLLASSYTMVRAVQEGKQENKNGVVKWLLLTIIGGLGFLSCQAWEWTNLLTKENMTIFNNPFGTHTENGVYLMGDGHDIKEGDSFTAGQTYLIPYHDGEYKPLQYKVTDGPDKDAVKEQIMGPKAFGGLFFFITGFHGFHVSIGIFLLVLVCVNAASGLYVKRRNGYEMIEKIGLYWHFVDLVWVFVFLFFYLL